MEFQYIKEKDEAGNTVATYLPSPGGRIDIIVRMNLRLPIESYQAYGNMLGPPQRPAVRSTIWSRCLELFLPAGYPHSVSSDYMWYAVHSYLVSQIGLHESISIDGCCKVPDLRKTIYSASLSTP